MEEVEGVDRGGFNTWDVAESLDDSFVFLVDDEWTSSLTMTTVAKFALSGSQFLAFLDLFNISVSTNSLQKGNGLFGLVRAFKGGGDDEWDFVNLFDAVTAGQDKRWNGGSSESGSSCESALVLVYLWNTSVG